MDDVVSGTLNHGKMTAMSTALIWRFCCIRRSTAVVDDVVTARCAWSGREQYATEFTTFWNFLRHTNTCWIDRYASPYWALIYWWISVGITLLLIIRQITERCSSLLHINSGASILKCSCDVMFFVCFVMAHYGHPWRSYQQYWHVTK